MRFAVLVVAALAGFSAGGIGGALLGASARGKAPRFWAAAVAAVVACAALDFVGLVQGWSWLSYCALGAMAGALTGLRYGYSDTLGKMRAVERDEAGDEADGAGAVDDGDAASETEPVVEE